MPDGWPIRLRSALQCIWLTEYSTSCTAYTAPCIHSASSAEGWSRLNFAAGGCLSPQGDHRETRVSCSFSKRQPRASGSRATSSYNYQGRKTHRATQARHFTASFCGRHRIRGSARWDGTRQRPPQSDGHNRNEPVWLQHGRTPSRA